MQFPCSISDVTCSVFIGNKMYQTDRSNPNWPRIVEAINSPDTTDQELIGLMQPINLVTEKLAGHAKVSVHDGEVWYGDEVINNALSARILDVLAQGFDIGPWIKFTENTYENPFAFSRDELYLFMEKSELPMTPDGCLLAYKKVKGDYKDIYSGKFDNSVGTVHSMPRENVDPDRLRTCSTGFHFCSKSYLPHFGASSGTRVVLVKINPADVVSIPADYDNAKGRCWRYEVVGEIPFDEAQEMIWPAVSSGYGDYAWDEDDEDAEIEAWLLDGWDDDDDDVGVEFDEVLDEPDINDFSAVEWSPITWDDLVKRAHEIVAQLHLPDPTVVSSSKHGEIDAERFDELLSQYGSLSAMAKSLGVSTGTVQAWKTKLFGKAGDPVATVSAIR